MKKPSEQYPALAQKHSATALEMTRQNVTTNTWAPSPTEWAELIKTSMPEVRAHADTLGGLQALLDLLDALHERLEKAGL